MRNVRAGMEKRGLELLLTFSSPGSMRYGQRGHVLYLSGYEPYFGDTMMLLPLEDDIEPLLQIDQADFFPEECTWVKNAVPAQDPVATLRSYLRSNGLGRARIGIAGEYSMTPQLVDRLRKETAGKIEFASDILEGERAVKSEYEMDCIRTAANIAHVGFEAARDIARPGITEAEMVSLVETACRLMGSEGFPHHTMVTSGVFEKHLDWWWYCGGRTMRKGDPWNMDLGTMFGAYCCDIARSFCLGKPTPKHEKAYSVLVDAIEKASAEMRPGVKASRINDIVIEIMSKRFEGDFSGIGHGVGLEVHEWPFVGYQYIKNDPVYRDSRLRENNVISIEPQVYLPEFGYLQIEDEFVVTKSGGKRISEVPLELLSPSR
ncbi:MAG: Xaa-Pro peptidase family protein [Thermoplasmata archaeon]